VAYEKKQSHYRTYGIHPKGKWQINALLGEILHDTAIPAPVAARRYIGGKGIQRVYMEKKIKIVM
jgi:hypothetical protein